MTPDVVACSLRILRRKAVARGTPLRVRAALCRFLARARYAREDDVEMIVTMSCKLTFGDASIDDVEGAVRTALYFARYDHPSAFAHPG